MAKHHSAAQITQALIDTKGMVYLAAKQLGCSPKAIYNRIKRSSAIRDAWEAANGEMGDTAELKLYQAIMNGEGWAIAFYLRTKGKNRGYTERVEHTGAEGGPIRITEVIIEIDNEPVDDRGA